MHARDGGLVWWYGKTDTVGGVRSDSLLVFKTDAAGRLAWSVTIDETSANYVYSWSAAGFPQLLEMSNGNLLFLASAGAFSSFNGTVPDFAFLMLDGSGNRLWQKEYYGYGFGSLAEGDNGDILSFGNGRFTRFDANGNTQAQWLYQPSGSLFTSEPAIASIDHHVYLESLYNEHSISGGNDWGMYLIKADYFTGNILDYRRYRLNSLVLSADTNSLGTTTLTVLKNRQGFVFTSNVFSPTPSKFEAIVFALDTNLNIARPGINLIKHYYSPLPGISFLDILCGTNDLGITACSFDDLTDRHISYYAEVDDNGAILAQRRLQFADPQYQLSVFPGDGNMLQQAMVSSQDQPIPYFLYLNSSPGLIGGAGCSGIDTSFLSTQPFMPTLSAIQFTQTSLDALTMTPVTTQGSAILINNSLVCVQKSICDTLKINGPDTVCVGDTGIRFTATKNVNCLRYTDWNADTSLVHFMARPDDTTVILSFRQSGRPYLSAYTRGCMTSDSLQITIRALRNVHLGRDSTLCPGDSLVLDAGSGYLSYLWQDASTDSFYKVDKAGTYMVQTVDQCDHSSSDTVVIGYLNKTLSAGSDLSLCAKEDGYLSASGGFAFYTWQPADAIVGDTTGQRITIRPPATTDFIVTAYDEGSCPLHDTVMVTVKNCQNRLLVPNAFTPNDDGRNDLIRPIVVGELVKYEFAIYNRWGQVVFRSLDPVVGWDGRINGHIQVADQFVWTCIYQFAGEEITSAKGVFLLLR